MDNLFKVGDIIRCIHEPNRGLINGQKYKVVKIEDGHYKPLILVKPADGGSISGGWYEDRFMIDNEPVTMQDIPVWSLDELEQAQDIIKELT